MTDIDLLGHMNNAAYWHAVEELLFEHGPDPRRPLRARLEHRHAVDLGDDVALVADSSNGALAVAFTVRSATRAIARVERTGTERIRLGERVG